LNALQGSRWGTGDFDNDLEILCEFFGRRLIVAGLGVMATGRAGVGAGGEAEPEVGDDLGVLSAGVEVAFEGGGDFGLGFLPKATGGLAEGWEDAMHDCSFREQALVGCNTK
jgi:hypothetical protein